MPKFTFTSPDGRAFTVEGPEGATKEQAFEVLQKRLATTSEGIPRDETDPRTGEPMAKPAAPPPEPSSSLLDKGVGAVQAAQSAALSLPASLAGNVAGAAKTLTGGHFGTPQGTQEGAQRARAVTEALTPTPASKEGKEALQGFSELVDRSGVMGINPAISLPAIPRLGSDLRAGAAATREAPAAAGRVARAAKAAVTPEIDAQTKALAQKAQALGIELRPDMLTDNRFVRMMGEALESVPLSGSKVEARQIAFNRALGKLIGADAKAQRLTPDVFDRAMTASGEKIGEIAERTPVHLAAEEEGGLDQALQAFVANAKKFETADNARIVSNYVDDLRAHADASGVIPGQAFRKVNTAIGQRMRTAEGDLKRSLSDLQDELQEALERAARPEDIQALQEARKQYAIGKAIEPLIAKSKNGDVSAPALMSIATATKDRKAQMARGRGGELGDLAKIGQAFIKEPKSSGTTERGLVYSLLGGAVGGTVAGAHAAGPLAGLGIYGAANLYNRLGGKLTKRLVADAPAEASP